MVQTKTLTFAFEINWPLRDSLKNAIRSHIPNLFESSLNFHTSLQFKLESCCSAMVYGWYNVVVNVLLSVQTLHMKECTNIPIEVQTLLMRIVSKLSILERCLIECGAIRSLKSHKKSQENFLNLSIRKILEIW